MNAFVQTLCFAIAAMFLGVALTIWVIFRLTTRDANWVERSLTVVLCLIPVAAAIWFFKLAVT